MVILHIYMQVSSRKSSIVLSIALDENTNIGLALCLFDIQGGLWATDALDLNAGPPGRASDPCTE